MFQPCPFQSFSDFMPTYFQAYFQNHDGKKLNFTRQKLRLMGFIQAPRDVCVCVTVGVRGQDSTFATHCNMQLWKQDHYQQVKHQTQVSKAWLNFGSKKNRITSTAAKKKGLTFHLLIKML